MYSRDGLGGIKTIRNRKLKYCPRTKHCNGSYALQEATLRCAFVKDGMCHHAPSLLRYLKAQGIKVKLTDNWICTLFSKPSVLKSGKFYCEYGGTGYRNENGYLKTRAGLLCSDWDALCTKCFNVKSNIYEIGIAEVNNVRKDDKKNRKAH